MVVLEGVEIGAFLEGETTMTNEQIQAELKLLHDLLQIGGYEEPRARFYARLAATIGRLPVSVEALCKQGRLCDIPGVGATTAALLSEYVLTGTSQKRKTWERRVPKGVLQLLAIPGIGVKTVRKLYQQAGIDSVEALERAVRQGALGSIDTRTATSLRAYFQRQSRQRRAQEALPLFAEEGLFAEV